jgi:hypothetical protein
MNKTQSNEFITSQVGKKRTLLILITLGYIIVGVLISSYLSIGWITAAILAFSTIAAYLVFGYVKKDKLLLNILVFAIVAGFTELLADYWLIHGIHRLVYIDAGPFVAASPLYMPFAWALVLTQLGYLGWLLSYRWNMWKVMLFGAVCGAVIIPYYEFLAKNAKWWYYLLPEKQFLNTPYLIILGEAIIIAILPPVFRKIEKLKPIHSIILGIFVGLWIWSSYFIAYLITG